MNTEGFYQDIPGEFYTLTDNFDNGHAYLKTELIYDTKTGQFTKGEIVEEANWADSETEEGTIPEYFIYVKTSDGYANLRTGPGTEYDVICRIPDGEALEVYREDATAKNGKRWLKVAYCVSVDEEKADWVTGWIAESQTE